MHPSSETSAAINGAVRGSLATLQNHGSGRKRKSNASLLSGTLHSYKTQDQSSKLLCCQVARPPHPTDVPLCPATAPIGARIVSSYVGRRLASSYEGSWVAGATSGPLLSTSGSCDVVTDGCPWSGWESCLDLEHNAR